MKVELNIDPACPEPRIVVYAAAMTPELERLLRSLDAPELVPAQDGRGGVALLAPADILRVYAERQRVFAQTAEGVYPLRARLYEMENRLAPHGFVRASSSELVNARKIAGMDFSLAGTIRLTLKGGVTTYVSRRQVAKIKKMFDL